MNKFKLYDIIEAVLFLIGVVVFAYFLSLFTAPICVSTAILA